MKKISLTTMILLALVLGMIIGVVLNNTASPETAKLYAQEISIFTTIFLRLIKMIIAPLVVSTTVVGIAKMGDAKALGRIFSKTLFLFICASLLSIALGLITVNFFMPVQELILLHTVPKPPGGRGRTLYAKSIYFACFPHQHCRCHGAQ